MSNCIVYRLTHNCMAEADSFEIFVFLKLNNYSFLFLSKTMAYHMEELNSATPQLVRRLRRAHHCIECWPVQVPPTLQSFPSFPFVL